MNYELRIMNYFASALVFFVLFDRLMPQLSVILLIFADNNEYWAILVPDIQVVARHPT